MNLTGKGLRSDGSENLDDLNALDERSDDRLVASPDQWLFNEWVIPSEANFDSKWYWNNIRNLNYFMTRYQRVNATESEVNPLGLSSMNSKYSSFGISVSCENKSASVSNF